MLYTLIDAFFVLNNQASIFNSHQMRCTHLSKLLLTLLKSENKYLLLFAIVSESVIKFKIEGKVALAYSCIVLLSASLLVCVGKCQANTFLLLFRTGRMEQERP